MTGVDAVALAEAFRAAYPGLTKDEGRTLAARCINNAESAFFEWSRADAWGRSLTSGARSKASRTLRDLLRPLWRDEP